MRVPARSPRTPSPGTVIRAQSAALVVIATAIVAGGLPWTLHGQDKDDPSLDMLNLKVVALSQIVTALEQKIATLQSQGSRVKAPFEVVDGAGKTIARIETTVRGAGKFTLGDSAAGNVEVGVGRSGAGYLIVTRSDGKNGVALGQYAERPMGVTVFEPAGANPIAELGAGLSGKGHLLVGDGDTGNVELGVGRSGPGFLVVSRSDGKNGVTIGQLQGRPMGVSVLDATGDKPVAELGIDASGGGAISVTDSTAKPVFRVSEKASGRDARVSIGAPEGRYGINIAGSSGTLLAGLGEAPNGAGSVSTFDRIGTLRAVMNGLQGEIHMVDATGKTRATMTADGAFSIRNATGATLVRIGEGSTGGGLLQLANSGGDAMVEAGVLATGAGLVRAYPLGSPGAGLVGLPGTFIVGRLAQK